MDIFTLFKSFQTSSMGVSSQKFASVFDAFWFLFAIVIGTKNISLSLLCMEIPSEINNCDFKLFLTCNNLTLEKYSFIISLRVNSPTAFSKHLDTLFF